jgi:predicted site-specific integrase-resolvase
MKSYTEASSTTPNTSRPLLFTIERTMHELGISRSTVNRWAESGKLTKHVLGPGTARITTASIYSLLGMQ